MSEANETLSEAAAATLAPAPSGTDEHTLRGLRMLFRIADGYWARGAVRQALELYTEIHDRYGHLPEAGPAETRLVEIAEWFEAKGDLRQARALAERFM